MKIASEISTTDVAAVYDGAEGDLFELVMGEQIHVGGFDASVDLAERAGIRPGQSGVDLCCCNGAGMRFLVRFRGVASMVGVDLSKMVVERGRERCAAEGSGERIRFVHADACDNGLPDASADFVWSEDAWCYVPDKAKVVAEAVRLVRPGGTIAFTDWVEGPSGMSDEEAAPLMHGMRFATLQDIDGYRALLEKNGCTVREASDTGRFADFADFCARAIETQLKYDAAQLLGFDMDRLAVVTAGFRLLGDMARAGKIAQARFVAQRP